MIKTVDSDHNAYDHVNHASDPVDDRVHLPGLRHQLAVLLPQQRGAGGREEPLESVEDGED